MKKLLLALFIVLTAHSAKAVTYYTFSQQAAVYADLNNPTVVTSTFTSEEYVLNLGVSFKLFGFDFGTGGNELKILRFGAMLGTNTSSDRMFALDGFLVKGFLPKDATSSISYTMEGAAGSRILKVQFKNASMEDADAGDYVNFQMWLYEDGSRMEVHIGPHLIADPGKVFVSGVPGPSIGIFLSDQTFTTDYETQFLDGDAASPTVSEELFNNLDNVPASNTVYTFSHGMAGIGKTSQISGGTLNVYPNPNHGKFTVESMQKDPVISVSVLSMSGTVQRTYPAGEFTSVAAIDISSLAPGMYVLACKTAKDEKHILIQKY